MSAIPSGRLKRRHDHLLAHRRNAHSCPRSRKRGRPTQCRVGISDSCIRRPQERSHTAARHRRRSCDAAPEKTQAGGAASRTHRLARFDLHRVTLRFDPASRPAARRADQHVAEPAENRCSACERRPSSSAAAAARRGRSECVRSAWRCAHARQGCVPAYTSETGRISAILPERRQLPNSTKTLFPTLGSARRSLGMYQSTKTSVGSKISAIGVPATNDWPTRARLVERKPLIGAVIRPSAKFRSTSWRRLRRRALTQ